jgi:hypothetical protein
MILYFDFLGVVEPYNVDAAPANNAAPDPRGVKLIS